jgi:ABC-type dipeptide/oligopeptide/nickel transport system permease component
MEDLYAKAAEYVDPGSRSIYFPVRFFAIPLAYLRRGTSKTLWDKRDDRVLYAGHVDAELLAGASIAPYFFTLLGWVPAGGNEAGFRSLILPGVCSGFGLMAQGTRQTLQYA